jgi:hypothetical protein
MVLAKVINPAEGHRLFLDAVNIPEKGKQTPTRYFFLKDSVVVILSFT